MNDAIAVGLVQINNSFSGQNYLPYSAGLLQACVQRHAAEPARYRFLLPVYKRLPVARAVAQLLEADVVAFSAYVWNVRLSLAIARELKRLKPDTLIVFGGPQVPDRGEPFVRQHPYIDLAVHGEGESAFRLLLEEYPRGRWDDVPALSFVRPDGTYVSTPRLPRISKLDTLPSPYLEGVFDPLIAAQPEEQWLALWETNRGCPFSCTFCDWGSATAAKVYQFDLPRLCEEIDWFARQRIEFVFCCDANFGMLPRDLELARRVVQVRARTGYPQALSVQNTKNATERAYQVQKTLADAGLNKGVTLSLQTVDAGSLAAIKRQNISSDFYQELQRRFSADGIETYTDMILGLPEETYDSFVNGIAHIVGNGQHNRIQFNNLSILPNAEMGDPAYQARHGLQLVSTRIINIHGSLAVAADDVQEYQELVVGTRTLSAADWRRTRALCWMTSFLYFDKVLQIPLLLLHRLGGLPFRDLLELFTEGDLTRYPTLNSARQFFLDKARDVQQGGEEYCRSEEWLNIWWPADELLLIQLCTEARLWDFYDEAYELLADFVSKQARGDLLGLLADAVALNRALLKLPFHESDLELELGHNVWALYQAARHGQDLPVEKGCFTLRIERTAVRYETWADWCRLVVWYGNKKGAYLYAGTVAERQLEGHY